MSCLETHSKPSRAVAWKTLRTPIVGLAVALALTACAARPDPADTAAVAAFEEANDPLEPTNRYFFEVNRFLDIIIVKPAASWYTVVPEFARDGIRNFLDNLRTPVILVNDLLQGETERAGTTTTRFFINTTVGILGLRDQATDWGYPRHDEDFGQTLAVWGVDEGPYLFLPILGPSPPRDLTGFIVDQFFDPLTYYYWNRDSTVPIIRFTLNGIDWRHRNLDTLDDIERTSIDFYATIRSLYRQARANEIRNGEPDVENLPDVDDIEFDFDEEDT